MKKILITLVTVLMFFASSKAQNVGINETGATPNTNAMLDINSDLNFNKGLLIPRLTTVQRTAMALALADDGMTVYDTSTKSFWYWNGSAWVEFGVDSRYWKLTGNSGTTVGTNFLGTIDSVDLAIYTFNTERIRILAAGNVGIGTTTPGYPLTVTSATAARTGSFINTQASTDNYGIYGECATTDNYGYGGYFKGGFIGVRGIVAATGAGSYFGVYATATGGTGNNYGVYGASDASSGFGVYASNSNATGTGLIAVGNGVGGSYLTSGTGVAATGTDGIFGKGTDAAGTGVIGTGNNGTATTLVGGSGVAGSGTEVGVYGYANSATGAGVLGQNGTTGGWAGDFQGPTKIGTATSDVHNFWGKFQAGSASDFHTIIPQTDWYSYVGTSTLAWYYMYSYNYAAGSRREIKRDIRPLNDTSYYVIMNDIEKMKPSLYKFKFETDELEYGNEAKYRPNTHIGLIVDEVPDYIQDNTFRAVDIYALSTFALAGVKFNRESIKKLQKKISDFGSNKMSGTEMWIDFSDDFSSKLSGNNIPIVTITSNNPNINLSITKKTNKGFKIEASQSVANLSVDWIAMAKVDVDNNNLTKEEIIAYKKKHNLLVPEEEKQKMKNWAKEESRRVDAINAKRVSGKKATTKIIKEKKLPSPPKDKTGIN